MCLFLNLSKKLKIHTNIKNKWIFKSNIMGKSLNTMVFPPMKSLYKKYYKNINRLLILNYLIMMRKMI